MADNDTVQLTDLEVIQQFSLAVRGATASRREVIAALESDLAYLGGRRSAGSGPLGSRGCDRRAGEEGRRSGCQGPGQEGPGESHPRAPRVTALWRSGTVTGIGSLPGKDAVRGLPLPARRVARPAPARAA